MNTNILLIYPKYTYPRKNPPLGLAYLASYIRERGYEPVIVDLNIDDLDDRDLTALIDARQPVAVGISFMTNQYGEALGVAAIAKAARKDMPIIAGGPHASALPRELLHECVAIDYVVVGEGEVTFAELLDFLGAGGDASNICGLCYRTDEGVVQNPRRELIADIDSLPSPAWDLLKPDKYSVHSITKENAYVILSSRGCPNQCIFCDSHTIFGRQFRGRSAENIFQELELLHRDYGMTSFDFVDDMITLKKERVMELCRLIDESGIAFTWMANARVNTLDVEMLAAMKKSGCVRIDVGVESGDPRVRARAKKGITDQQIINAHKMAREAGIQVGTFTMVGNLGETMSSVKMTADLLKDISDDVMVSIACPFPGTELYRIARDQGYLRVTDWSRYVTSPTYLAGYEPVMVTDEMDQDQIVEAYYYLHARFAKQKFRARYGKCFFLNPAFLKQVVSGGGMRGFARRGAMFIKLVRAGACVRR